MPGRADAFEAVELDVLPHQGDELDLTLRI